MDDIDLGLDISDLVRPGRQAAPLTAEVTREIVQDDLHLLAARPAEKAPTLRRISERHHTLARLVAQGHPDGHISLMTGYTPSRISILKADPMVKELIEHYRKLVEDALVDFQASLLGLSFDALNEVRERLEQQPESFTVSQLMSILSTTADRAGHGPQRSETVNVNHNIASRMDAARKRLRDQRASELVEVEDAVEIEDGSGALKEAG